MVNNRDEQDVQQIELSMEKARVKIDLAESLKRLEVNADFKKMFLDSYLKDYAIRLIELKASPQMQDDKNQTYIVGQLNAIGHLSQYIGYIRQEGAVAKASVEADIAERNAIMEENKDA